MAFEFMDKVLPKKQQSDEQESDSQKSRREAMNEANRKQLEKMKEEYLKEQEERAGSRQPARTASIDQLKGFKVGGVKDERSIGPKKKEKKETNETDPVMRQTERPDDIDELYYIRENQRRLNEEQRRRRFEQLTEGLEEVDPTAKEPQVAEETMNIDPNVVQKEAKRSRRKRPKTSVTNTDTQSIQSLRKDIERETVPTYDPEEMANAPLVDENGEEQDPTDFISGSELDSMRDGLNQTKPGLVIRGMTDPEAREALRKEVKDIYGHQTRGRDFLIDYVVRETVGMGVVEKIIENDPTITDIGYDGEKLIVESSDKKYVYESNQEINDDYIIRLVTKFANANNDEFTEKKPVFDGHFHNIRINAVHPSSTTVGVTMALRVVRPKLALQEATFDGFAPHYVYQLFESAVQAKGNFMIAGETGTGKTELQKMLASFIPFDQRIVLIEDVAETFLKEMFPNKDIYSWLTSEQVGITKMIKAGLRNNPRWILVSETRGAEAFEMIQAVLSGHSIITTLHAINAQAIPKRLVNMAKMGYEFSEEGLEEDIRRYFDLGLHIVRRQYKGKTVRYLSEILYFSIDGNHTIFKQDYIEGQFVVQTRDIPRALKQRIRQAGHSVDEFPEDTAHLRDITVEKAEEEGREVLDMEVTEGRTLSYEELQELVTEVIVDKDALSSNADTRFVPTSPENVQETNRSDLGAIDIDVTGQENDEAASKGSVDPTNDEKETTPADDGTAESPGKDPIESAPSQEPLKTGTDQ